MFLRILQPGDWFPGHHSQQTHDEEIRTNSALDTEASSDVGHDQTETVGRDAERIGHAGQTEHRRLQVRPDGEDLASSVVLSGCCEGLYGRGAEAVEVKTLADHQRS